MKVTVSNLRQVRFNARPGAGRSGFTLLELLIVVATISVLSGIAVPVFLEAQTRTKVARARSDMRMIALAMESYFADHTDYPLPDDHSGGLIPEETITGDPYDTRIPVSLTTPVSYIDNLIDDPFKQAGEFENELYLITTREYFETALGPGSYENYLVDLVGPDSVLQVTYVLVSRGPDLNHEEPNGHTWATDDGNGDNTNGLALYDPTNGTLSNGDIIYMGAGIGYKDN